jgi:site-specific DNA recombinase
MRVVAYARVSTADQAAEGVSLEAQQARIAAWCSGQGATLEAADVHVDAGLSGKRASNRPALQAALDAACRGRGVLVVSSLSRLARSTRDAIAIAERLEQSGAQLVSLSESLDTTTAAGRMMFRMLAVLAEFERELIGERTRLARSHKRARGERWGQLAYGQAVAADGRALVADERGAEALVTIRRLRAVGLSLRRIAAELTARGIPTKNGKGRWSFGTVGDILERDARHAQDRPQVEPPRPELPAS